MRFDVSRIQIGLKIILLQRLIEKNTFLGTRG